MKNALTEYEWMVVEEIVEIMHPAYVLMKKMQSKTFTLSDFFSTWTLIKISMKEYEKKPNMVTNLTDEMFKNMLKFEPQIFLNPLLLCAVYMDPRVSRVLSQTNDQGIERMVVARSKLMDVYKRLQKKRNDEQTQPVENSVGTTSRFTNLEAAFDAYLDSMEPEDTSSNDQGQNPIEEIPSSNDLLAIEEECIDFEKEKRLPLKTNILEFWELKKKKYPKLYSISQVIMAVPSSQTSVERAFSTFGFIFSSLRTLMSPEILQAVLLIRNNPEVFEEVAEEQLAKAGRTFIASS